MNTAIEAKRRALLELQLRRQQAEKAGHDRITAIPRQGQLPCSYQQEGLWFLHQLDPTSRVYHIALAVRLRGHLDVDALRRALTALVARHESLRTRFQDDSGPPAAIIDPAPETWPMPIVELSDDEVQAWAQTQAYLPFDLRTGPLFRSSLARVQPGDHILLLVAHHIVADGWSMSVLTRDVSELYSAAVGAKPRQELAELTIQAVDHAGWQRRWLAGAQAQQQLSYWQNALEEIQTLEFPTDRIWPAEPTGAGAMFRQPLPGGLVAAVRELARSEQVSLLAVLLAGFLAVLHRYTGQQDLAVGTVFSGRTRTEIEPLVGYFAETLVLRTSLAGDPDLRELIHRCHDTVVGAAANQDVPFGLVVEALNPERVQGRNPLFQVGFLLQTTAVGGGSLDLGGLAVAEVNTSADRSRFDLSAVIVEQADGGLELTVEYSTELFDTDRIARLADHFSNALGQLRADPGIRISQCEVVAEAERARLLGEWGEGQPLAGHRAYVLDERLLLAPIGIPGHLYLTSTGTAQDYPGRPDLTAEKFLPDPYSLVPGGRRYATGDLARWRADGNLVLLGRVDRQAKIRGLRIDLAKIEHILGDDAAVREALAVVKQAGTPQARLIGYLAPEPGHDIDLGQVRERLTSQLPAYLMPIAVLTLPRLPLSSNGEIDQAQLPDPESQPDAGDAALTTDTQRLLAGIWLGLLGEESGQIGSHDSFFALGGNSLWIALLVVKIRDVFQVRLDPSELFIYPEVCRLATRIDQLIELAQENQGKEQPGEPTSALAHGTDLITPVARGGHLACSYQQEGLWLLSQLDPASPRYSLPVAIRISGELDIAALSQALAALIARHESLRTRIDDSVDPAGVPFQVIDAPADAWPLPVAELAPGGDVANWVDAEASRRFDLRTGPVFRSSILRLAPDEHVLVLVLHRIVADGWSVAVLAGELSHAYDAARSGLTAPLPELAIQPADYAAWQRQRSFDGGLDRELDYWIAVLGDLEEVAFPADRRRAPGSAGTEALLARRLPGGLVAAVRELARSEQVSLLAVLLAGFLAVLHRYTGQQDLAVGTVFSGRTRTEIEPLVGYFAETLVLRTSLAGDPDLRELIHRCHDTVVGAAANQDVPFGLVVEALNPERVQGRNPLVQIGFSLMPAAAVRTEFRFGVARTEQLGTGLDQPPLDLAVSVTDNGGEVLDVAVKYRAELFDADRIARLAEHFSTALAQLTVDPGIRISQCEVVAEAERTRPLGERGAGPARIDSGKIEPILLGAATLGTDTERRLAGIWRGLLAGASAEIGSHDSFLALGGSSLRIALLIARIREEFEVTLHPRELSKDPSLAQLAVLIDRQPVPNGQAASARPPVPALVPLQPDGTKAPLFLVHAVGGSVTPYLTLAPLLGADQPCYGLEHPGLRGDTAVWSVSELAAGYLAAVQEVQAAGPYHLGGWSFGGVVAVEMARQLQSRGAEVAIVLVLDSGLPTAGYSPDQAELLSWFARDVAALADAAPPSLDLTGLAPDKQIDLTLAALESAGLGSAAIRAELRKRVMVFLANNRVHLAHQLEPYDGRLVLLRAIDEPDDVTEQWRALAPGGFECYTVRGTHYSVLQPPYVTDVAGVMRRCLGDLTIP